MNKYVLQFKKQGNMKYISHLDLHRLFKRSLKKAEISLDYSKGFNPHEMINIVQPLSLGFESLCEYVEMESPQNLIEEEVLEKLNNFLPAGLFFISMKKIQKEKKNLSALCAYASYHIEFPMENTLKDLQGFMQQESIIIEKKDKKTGLFKEKDVKAQILKLNAFLDEEKLKIDCTLRCATNETLNPLLLAKAFCRYLDFSIPDSYIQITRTGLFAQKEEKLVSLFDIYTEDEIL